MPVRFLLGPLSKVYLLILQAFVRYTNIKKSQLMFDD